MPKTRKIVKVEDDDITAPRVFIPEAVLNKRYKAGEPQYLMKWKDYPKEFATWEPSDTTITSANYDEFIKEFEKKRSDMKMTNPKVKIGLIPQEKRPDRIIGSKKIKGKFYFLVQYLNGSVQLLHKSDVRKRHPELALEYYERLMRKEEDEEFEKAKKLMQLKAMLPGTIPVPE